MHISSGFIRDEGLVHKLPASCSGYGLDAQTFCLCKVYALHRAYRLGAQAFWFIEVV